MLVELSGATVGIFKIKILVRLFVHPLAGVISFAGRDRNNDKRRRRMITLESQVASSIRRDG